jgi:hypothetical protein
MPAAGTVMWSVSEGIEMAREDGNYFEDRAEEELRRARNAPHPGAARAHYIMAGHYLDIVHNGRESWMAAVQRDIG